MSFFLFSGLEASRDFHLARRASLTAREREILDLVMAGKTNRLIARGLGLSVKAVEKHRGCVMSKLRVSSLAHLVRLELGSWVERRN